MRAFVLVALTAAIPSTAAAQFDAGQISGFVRDAQQAAIPGATVTVTNEGNADRRTSITNSAGYYVLPNIPVGSYAVSVELSGFKKFVKTGIRLSAASQLAVDAELELGSLEETVLVTAGAAFVQTTTAQVARTIDTRQIQELTLNGRNPIYLASLKPGVRGGTIGTFDPDSVSNGSFSINGARDDEYLVTIDGAIATRTRSSGSMLGAQDVETTGPSTADRRRDRSGSSPRAARSSSTQMRSRTTATRRSTRTSGSATGATTRGSRTDPMRTASISGDCTSAARCRCPADTTPIGASSSSSGAKSGFVAATRRRRRRRCRARPCGAAISASC